MAPAEYHLFNWTDTTIWKLLENKDAAESEQVRVTLQKEMPDIQVLLSQGGTSPTDFTLHDSQHCFRVAQRMAEIIPPETLTALSPYELALLLLAAYLHDIGMNPPKSMLRYITDFLVLGSDPTPSNGLAANFINWIDSQDADLSDLLSRRPINNPDDLIAANLALAHYCRHRHVDLSEEWISKNLSEQQLGSYAQWIPDLKNLCRSHNEGYAYLASRLFDPKPAGSPGHIVHLRYLAAVLRVADIIEFDPERTPDVIFSHRDISPGSIIYWFKDHLPTRTIEHGRMTITASPPDAKYHRAIEQMCNDIEAELRLVDRLKDERPFSHMSFQVAPGYHTWALSPNLRRNIIPLNNQYEYIDGAFRPNTKKVLQLLSGRRLYKDDKVALRELLQNALDAVRERIALERLTRTNPEDDAWNDRIGQVYQVVIEVKEIDGRIWIACTDDGVGMSKAIITQFLLVSGVSQRGELRQLNRKCREHGFKLERTGQFGIGVLSYFMIADYVSFTTKRNSLCSDAENNGWVFETESIGGFGELRVSKSSHLGTIVSFRLKRDVVAAWLRDVPDKDTGGASKESKSVFTVVLSYLQRCLCHVPCVVIVKSKDGIHRIEPGWNDFLVGVMKGGQWPYSESGATYNSSALVSQKKRELAELAYREEQALSRDFEETLKWKRFSGVIKDQDIGFCFWLPVFYLNQGQSPAYAAASLCGGKLATKRFFSMRQDLLLRPTGTVIASWKGMSVQIGAHGSFSLGDWQDLGGYGLIQIDFRGENAGLLSVSRESLLISVDAVLKPIVTELLQCYKKVLDECSNAAPFSPIWSLLLTKKAEALPDSRWPLRDVSDPAIHIWDRVSFPAVDISDYGYSGFHSPLHRGKHLSLVNRLELDLNWADVDDASFPVPRGYKRLFASWSDGRPVDRIVKVMGPEFRLAAVFLQDRSSRDRLPIEFCDYPPEWSNLVGVIRQDVMLLNKGCSIASLVKAESEFDWFRFRIGDGRLGFEDRDPRFIKHKILASRSSAALWLVLFIAEGDWEVWEALFEADPAFLEQMCDILGITPKDRYAFAVQAFNAEPRVFVFGRSSVSVEYGRSVPNWVFPDPASPEWRIDTELKEP